VVSSITYTIAALANLENITLTGTANLNATGNAAHNVLAGNSGNNILDGGDGNDTLTGGAGKDNFQFAGTAANTTTNRDILTDFTPGTDKLVFSRAVYGGFTTATTISSAQLVQGATFSAFTATTQRFGYNSSTGILYFDADGSGKASTTQQVALLGTLTHPGSLATADFSLIA
jgi:Ca2+-binding RTX toxin-like protein